jgi:hypothetical protein
VDANSQEQTLGVPTMPSPSQSQPPTPDRSREMVPHTRRNLWRRSITISSGLVLLAAVFLTWVVTSNTLNPTYAGQVIFTTDPPTSMSAKTCKFDHQVTSVTAGVPVYAVYFYKARLTNQTIALTVEKNGTRIAQNALAPMESNGVDCLEDPLDVRSLGAIGVGRYDFKMSIATGEIVSEGTLIVAAPTPRPTRGPVTPTGHAGQVVFTTDMPSGASAATCKVGHEVTSVTAGTQLYATYFYKARLVDETVVVHLFFRGIPQSDTVLAPSESNGVDCFEDPVALRVYPAGDLTLRVSTLTGEIVSEGTLIIEAPTSPPSRNPATPS